MNAYVIDTDRIVRESFVGLSLGMAESRLHLPTAVTVPALTILQLLFSELVMGRTLSGDGYFEFAWQEAKDVLHAAAFSRYADMAYQACHNEIAGIPGDFWCNAAVLAGYGLCLPLLVLAVLLATAGPQE